MRNAERFRTECLGDRRRGRGEVIGVGERRKMKVENMKKAVEMIRQARSCGIYGGEIDVAENR